MTTKKYTIKSHIFSGNDWSIIKYSNVSNIVDDLIALQKQLGVTIRILEKPSAKHLIIKVKGNRDSIENYVMKFILENGRYFDILRG